MTTTISLSGVVKNFSFLVVLLIMAVVAVAKAEHTSLPTCCSVVDVDMSTAGTSRAAALVTPDAAPVLVVGDRAYVTATFAVSGDGSDLTIDAVSWDDETHQALQMVASRLASVGLHRDDIITLQFVTHASNTSALYKVDNAYSRFFAKSAIKPCRSLMNFPIAPNTMLPYLLHISAIAHNRHYKWAEPCAYPKREIGGRLLPFVAGALKIGNEIYTSPLWSEAQTGAYAQAVHGLNKVKNLLEGEEMSKSDIVKINVHVGAGEDMEQINRAYREFFADMMPPARSVIQDQLFREVGVRVKFEVLAHKAPNRCNIKHYAYNVEDNMFNEPELYSHAVRVGNRIHTSTILPTTPLQSPLYNNTLNTPETFYEQLQQALANLERVTQRQGASRTKWVWMSSRFNSPDSMAVQEYHNHMSSFLNGTSVVPCPKQEVPGNAYLFSAEAIAYVNLNGADFYPASVDFASLASEQEQLLGITEGSLDQITACTYSTNPACPDSSAFRSI